MTMKMAMTMTIIVTLTMTVTMTDNENDDGDDGGVVLLLRGLRPRGRQVQKIGVCDAQTRDRVGPAGELLDHAKSVDVFDHHVDRDSDITAATLHIEQLRKKKSPSPKVMPGVESVAIFLFQGRDALRRYFERVPARVEEQTQQAARA